MGFDTNRPATTAYDPKKGINQPGKDAVQVSVTPNSSATNNPYAVNVSPMANQTNNPYIKPQAPKQPSSAQPQSPNPYGSQSGPGILEQWFNQRANGADPGWLYAMGRGMDSIDNRMAAGGSYNSGARGQQLSDYAANMGAQRESQLDTLATGASAEHMGRLNAMFGQGLGMSQGMAGLASAYDLGAAGNMGAANEAQQQMYLNKAGVDQQAAQSHLNSAIQGYAAYQSGKK